MPEQAADEDWTIRNEGSEFVFYRIFATVLIVSGLALAAFAIVRWYLDPAGRALIGTGGAGMIMFGLTAAAAGIWWRITLRRRSWIINSATITHIAPNGSRTTLRWDEIERFRFHQKEGFFFIGPGGKIKLDPGGTLHRRAELASRLAEILRLRFDVPEDDIPWSVFLRSLSLRIAIATGSLIGWVALLRYFISALAQGRPAWILVLVRRLLVIANPDKSLLMLFAKGLAAAVLLGPMLATALLFRLWDERSLWHSRRTLGPGSEPGRSEADSRETNRT